MSEPAQVAGLVMSSLGETKKFKHDEWWKSMGNYKNVSTSLDTTTVNPSLAKNDSGGHAVNYEYLRRIISLCKKHDIKLYFLESPTYHPEYFYDQEYFYRAYRENFSDVELIDYSKWPMDPSERFDAHYLNHKGAVRFT